MGDCALRKQDSCLKTKTVNAHTQQTFMWWWIITVLTNLATALFCFIMFFFSSGLLLLSRVSHTKLDIKHWSVMCVSTAFHSNTVCTTGDVLSYSSAWTGDFVVANTVSMPNRQYDSHHNHGDTIDCMLAQCQGHVFLFSYLFSAKAKLLHTQGVNL